MWNLAKMQPFQSTTMAQIAGKVGRLVWPFAVAYGVLGCAPMDEGAARPVCNAADCSLSVVLGPGDGSYVPAALEATAAAFLGPGGGSGASSGSGSAAGGLPRIRLDRDTLSPGKGTLYTEPRNQSLGLRAEATRPLWHGLQGYGAMSLGAVRHDYRLPQGLGPLTDPITVAFRTVYATPEIGVRYDFAIGGLPGVAGRLSAGTGIALGHTRTHLRSALLDVRSTTTTTQPFVSLGAGLVLDPPGTGQVELVAGGRMGKGGAGVLRSELRLSR